MPKPTVAILGASPDRSKFGNKSIRAHLRAGYDVFPVNRKGGQIEGLAVSLSLSEIPVDQLDRISVYLPPQIGLNLLPEIAEAKAGEIWFNPGSESSQLLKKCRELGLNVIAGCSIVELGLSPSQFPDE